MRVCYTPHEVVEAFHANVHGRTLVDRFLENAIEIDVDALADGHETYIGAVMQHVEEAGVHSGDSACVLPAPSLSAAQEKEISDTVRKIAQGLGVVGLLNVELASAAGLPSAFAKAERAAGRRLPNAGTVFLSVRDADKPALVPVAAALAGLGFQLIATSGTASTLEAAGLDVERVRKMTEEGVGAT